MTMHSHLDHCGDEGEEQIESGVFARDTLDAKLNELWDIMDSVIEASTVSIFSTDECGRRAQGSSREGRKHPQPDPYPCDQAIGSAFMPWR